MKTIKEKPNKHLLYILLALVKIFKLQTAWNWIAGKTKTNLFAMKNNNGNMCLFRHNLHEPTWERLA